MEGRCVAVAGVGADARRRMIAREGRRQSPSVCRRKEQIRRSAALQGVEQSVSEHQPALACLCLLSPHAACRGRSARAFLICPSLESHIERAIAFICRPCRGSKAPTLLCAADRAAAPPSAADCAPASRTWANSRNALFRSKDVRSVHCRVWVLAASQLAVAIARSRLRALGQSLPARSAIAPVSQPRPRGRLALAADKRQLADCAPRRSSCAHLIHNPACYAPLPTLQQPAEPAPGLDRRLLELPGFGELAAVKRVAAALLRRNDDRGAVAPHVLEAVGELAAELDDLLLQLPRELRERQNQVPQQRQRLVRLLVCPRDKAANGRNEVVPLVDGALAAARLLRGLSACPVRLPVCQLCKEWEDR